MIVCLTTVYTPHLANNHVVVKNKKKATNYFDYLQEFFVWRCLRDTSSTSTSVLVEGWEGGRTVVMKMLEFGCETSTPADTPLHAAGQRARLLLRLRVAVLAGLLARA